VTLTYQRHCLSRRREFCVWNFADLLAGSTGTYFSNRILRNNIRAEGVLNYKSGVLFPGGAASGRNQQSCTAAVVTGQSVPNGTVCPWTYTRNVLGVGQWPNQTNNNAFPSTKTAALSFLEATLSISESLGIAKSPMKPRSARSGPDY
jgi:hypothetical protein